MFGNSIPSNRTEQILNYWDDPQVKYLSDGTVGPGSIPSSAPPERSFLHRLPDPGKYPYYGRRRCNWEDIDDDEEEEEEYNPRKSRASGDDGTTGGAEDITIVGPENKPSSDKSGEVPLPPDTIPAESSSTASSGAGRTRSGWREVPSVTTVTPI